MCEGVGWRFGIQWRFAGRVLSVGAMGGMNDNCDEQTMVAFEMIMNNKGFSLRSWRAQSLANFGSRKSAAPGGNFPPILPQYLWEIARGECQSTNEQYAVAFSNF